MGIVTFFAAIWKRFLGTTIGRWLVGIGAVAAALGVAWYLTLRKGKQEQAAIDEAKDAAEQVQVAQQIQHAAQTRAEVDSETAKLPDAPAQTVATADPHTAAGELRTDGWVRDDATSGH